MSAEHVHQHAPNRPGGVFCRCGKVVDLAGLKSIDVAGFRGPQSLNPKMETFWETGDPSVFDSPKKIERKTLDSLGID